MVVNSATQTFNGIAAVQRSQRIILCWVTFHCTDCAIKVPIYHCEHERYRYHYLWISFSISIFFSVLFSRFKARLNNASNVPTKLNRSEHPRNGNSSYIALSFFECIHKYHGIKLTILFIEPIHVSFVHQEIADQITCISSIIFCLKRIRIVLPYLVYDTSSRVQQVQTLPYLRLKDHRNTMVRVIVFLSICLCACDRLPCLHQTYALWC